MPHCALAVGHAAAVRTTLGGSREFDVCTKPVLLPPRRPFVGSARPGRRYPLEAGSDLFSQSQK